MKRAFGVICIICVIYLAALMIGFYKYELNAQSEIEHLLLSRIIDYSADGAMAEALNLKDVGIDYTDENSLKMDPDLILDSFLDIFCINYDIGRGKEAKKYVTQNFLPVVCVAAFDGYYIATPQPVRNDWEVLYPSSDKLVNSRWDLTFGPKMPYTYKYNDKSTGSESYYALNMGMDYAYKENGGRYEGLVPGLKNKQAGMIEINKLLIKKISDSIDYVNSTNTKWEHTFSLPLQLSSYSGNNPIQGPSLIIFAQDVDLRTSRPISGFSISGTRVEKARVVVGYIRNGIKYYCYADKAPDKSKIDGDGEVSDVFSSINDAAQAGYYCDLEYMR
jgi:hypothetical protein